MSCAYFCIVIVISCSNARLSALSLFVFVCIVRQGGTGINVYRKIVRVAEAGAGVPTETAEEMQRFMVAQSQQHVAADPLLAQADKFKGKRLRDCDGGRKRTYTDWEVVSVHTNSDAKGDYYYAQCALVVDGVVASDALSKIGTNLDEAKGKLLHIICI